ncbi:MAG: hypothetical protein QM667_00355 [Asticcacaulis sp.]
MKSILKAVTAVFAVSALLAGTAYAQGADCRRKCNEAYAACQKSGKAEEKCRAAWLECKKKCPAT